MIEDIIDYMKDELQIKISKEKEQQVIDKFYDISKNRIKDLIYWSIDINERSISFFYDGLITKNDYEKIKNMDEKKHINFGEIAKHCYAEAYIKELVFTDDTQKIMMYLQGNQQNRFDLMEELELELE